MNIKELKNVIFDGKGRSINKETVDKRKILIKEIHSNLSELKGLISLYQSIEDTSKIMELLIKMNDNIRNAQSNWWNIKNLSKDDQNDEEEPVSGDIEIEDCGCAKCPKCGHYMKRISNVRNGFMCKHCSKVYLPQDF